MVAQRELPRHESSDEFLKELLDWLARSVTKERLSTLAQALEALETAGWQEHHGRLNQLRLDTRLDNPTDEIDEASRVIEEAIEGVLLQFGVTLEEQASLAQSTSVLQGLQLLDNVEDTDQLHDMIEGEESAEEALAVLLNWVGQYPTEVYLETIQAVETTLMDRILELNVPRPVPASPIAPVVRNRIQRYLATYPDCTLLREWVDNGGATLEVSTNTLIKVLGRELSQIEPQRLPQELAGLLLLVTPDQATQTRAADELAFAITGETSAASDLALQIVTKFKRLSFDDAS